MFSRFILVLIHSDAIAYFIDNELNIYWIVLSGITELGTIPIIAIIILPVFHVHEVKLLSLIAEVL